MSEPVLGLGLGRIVSLHRTANAQKVGCTTLYAVFVSPVGSIGLQFLSTGLYRPVRKSADSSNSGDFGFDIPGVVFQRCP